jgi:hypothetical protein
VLAAAACRWKCSTQVPSGTPGVRGKTHHFGHYEDDKDAAHAYDRGVLRLLGEVGAHCTQQGTTILPRCLLSPLMHSHYGRHSAWRAVGLQLQMVCSLLIQCCCIWCALQAGHKRLNFPASSYTREEIEAPRELRRGSSDYRGVSWFTAGKQWIVQLRIGPTMHRIGTFDDEVEAARAYDRARLRMVGPVSGPSAGDAL